VSTFPPLPHLSHLLDGEGASQESRTEAERTRVVIALTLDGLRASLMRARLNAARESVR